MDIVIREKLSAVLPATACLPGMKTRLEEIAKREGVKLADIQRSAYSLFLQTYDSKAINNRKSSEQQREKKEA